MYWYLLTLVVELRLCGGSPTEVALCHPRILISSACEHYKLQTQSIPLSRHCGAASYRGGPLGRGFGHADYCNFVNFYF
jgi:hypothetical protein